MTSLAQNILENFQKVTETEAKPSRSDENLNTLFYNGKAIEKEIQTEQTGEFPSWISGRVYPTVLESSLTIIESSYPKIFKSWVNPNEGLMCRNGPGKFDIGDDTFGHWFGKD